ncbi:hypothetical protein [Novosphingobium sp. LASN5T]|uniref:hypothetical protein n=1 Tax=Novosphingobium sp. LASN5T TaxID=2491021 RepID=UPI000F5ECCFC|nr:hypothetical protein [Novosphingobium sp. LASN5T]RQW44674.1 hypothetical protein EH199_08045 [Novosphingobium sp. LASN5T]
MPKMTRAHYNLIADATAAIISRAQSFGLTGDNYRAFQDAASRIMTDAMAGTNSQFKAVRFRDRCVGIRCGR